MISEDESLNTRMTLWPAKTIKLTSLLSMLYKSPTPTLDCCSHAAALHRPSRQVHR